MCLCRFLAADRTEPSGYEIGRPEKKNDADTKEKHGNDNDENDDAVDDDYEYFEYWWRHNHKHGCHHCKK